MFPPCNSPTFAAIFYFVRISKHFVYDAVMITRSLSHGHNYTIPGIDAHFQPQLGVTDYAPRSLVEVFEIARSAGKTVLLVLNQMFSALPLHLILRCKY